MKKRLIEIILLICIISVGVVNAAPTYKDNYKEPVDFLYYNNCTGEIVHIVGTIHVTDMSFSNKNSQKSKLHVLYVVKGVGEDTGAPYHVKATFNESEKISEVGADVFSTKSIVEIKAADGCTDYSQWSERITINANGVITVDRQVNEWGCSDECL